MDNKKIFYDESLKDYENFIFSCFEAIKKFRQENFFFFFLKETKTDLVFARLDEIRIDYKYINEESIKIFEDLKKYLVKQSTSFSLRHKELELIFLIITEDNSNLLTHI